MNGGPSSCGRKKKSSAVVVGGVRRPDKIDSNNERLALG